MVALAGVTGLDVHRLTVMTTSILALFYVVVPFWVVWAFAGFSAMFEIWPAILLAGVVFGGVEITIARVYGPWLVDVSAAIVTIAVLLALFRVWQPRRILNAMGEDVTGAPRSVREERGRTEIGRALLPWGILIACVALWGTPAFGHWLDHFSTVLIRVHGLDGVVLRVLPAVTVAAAEPAVFTLNLLSATGTGIFVAALVAGIAMGMRAGEIAEVLWGVVKETRLTVVTIAALMMIGFLSRYCGMDATLGLAFAATGALYPFFGTYIGWVGTASTGSDTSSNVLFGSLQKLTAQQLGLSPYLMAAANSAGGVMAKMISPQNVVVGTTATGIYGKEGKIVRYLIVPSLVLAGLVGMVVWGMGRWGVR
jgi:lactate permease